MRYDVGTECPYYWLACPADLRFQIQRTTREPYVKVRLSCYPACESSESCVTLGPLVIGFSRQGVLDVKAVILAGGLGTRISEESQTKPKPMVEIGGRPILWHIMRIYSHYGVNEFVICLGYRGYVIKEYFANYCLHLSDVTFDMSKDQMHVHHRHTEPWVVTLVDTGESTLTGGRLKRVRNFLNDESFCFTYGDGVSDVPIDKLIEHHKRNQRTATMTAIQPPGRYGAITIDGDRVSSFQEKPAGDGAWINGGFFVLEPAIFNYLDGDSTSFEAEPLQRLVADDQLTGYKHSGYWQAMDTLRDKNQLEELWSKGVAPWKVWE